MRFDQSRVLDGRACRTCPGVIHGNYRTHSKPQPVYRDHGCGSHVRDVDGNEFIDIEPR